MSLSPAQSGAFFVIDGTDGSGKATQTKRLVERFESQGYRVETISFPQYGKHSCTMVEAYLAGRYGKHAQDVNAHAASMLFAVDRFDASFQIREWLSEGAVVIADRYVGSNMGHQGSKITDPEQRSAYLTWNEDLEYNLFGIPRPNVNIVLCVPAETAQQLARQAASEKTKVSGDIHEADLEHLRAAEATYREIANRFPGFQLIECSQDGVLRSIDEIHNDVWQIVSAHHPHPSSPLTPTPLTNV